MKTELAGLRAFLYENVYRHPTVNRAREEAKALIRALFERYIKDPQTLPEAWRDEGARRPRAVCDYIAGMTDRYAAREYERLFGKPLSA